MNTIFNYLLATVLLLSFTTLANTQNSELAPCGTDIGVSDWLRDFQSRIDATPRTDDLMYLPLQIHVVGTDEGGGYMGIRTVMQSFCTLNRDFEPADIQFYLNGPINYIDNTDWYDHNFNQGFQMMNQNNINGVINCYIVDSPAGNCGYFAPGVDGIALAKGCTQPADHTWAHEVGHFLSLPHPFDGTPDDIDFDQPAPNYLERVNGSNCQFANDGFCDTAPDYLGFRWGCNADNVSNQEQTDPNGVTFRSDGTLFMSYSNAACKNRFSGEQITAMRANVEEQRSYLLSPIPAEGTTILPDVEALTVISPAIDQLVNTPTVRLEWEAIENAALYLVQVSRIPSFPPVASTQYMTQNTFVDFGDMLPLKEYYWRVLPYNEYDTCLDFLDIESFSTGDGVTSTNDLLPGESVTLVPNPVSNQQGATVVLNSQENTTATWSIRNMHGQMMQTKSFQAIAGEQRIALPTQPLAAGIYMVQIQLNDRSSVQKLVIY